MHIAVRIRAIGGERSQVRPQEQRDDGGVKRRIGEIVHAPAELFALRVFRHFFVISAAMACNFT